MKLQYIMNYNNHFNLANIKIRIDKNHKNNAIDFYYFYKLIAKIKKYISINILLIHINLVKYFFIKIILILNNINEFNSFDYIKLSFFIIKNI